MSGTVGIISSLAVWSWVELAEAGLEMAGFWRWQEFGGGRSGGRQHTESEAGEAKTLRIGQRDINKLLFIDHGGLVVRRYPCS